MKPRLLALALITLVPVAGAPAQDAARKDQEAMQGTWKVAQFLAAGKDQPDDLLKKLTVVIAGDRLTLKLDGNVLTEGQFKLDPSKSPKQIDMTALTGPDKGQVSLGIYEVNGDKLRTCYRLGTEAIKTRPGGFEGDKAAPTQVMVLRRDKK